MGGLFWTVDDFLPAGVGFSRFGGGHIAALALAAALVAALCLAYRAHPTKAFRLTAAFVILASELFRTGLFVAAGVWDVYRLPLHLCGLAVFFTLAQALTESRFLLEVLWSFCMPGAAAALLFPDWTAYPLASAMSANAFFVHAMLVAYPAMRAAAGDFRPEARRLPGCFGFLALVAALVYWFDRRFGTNYFFLLYPAPGSPLSWFASFLGEPGYLLGYLPMLAVVWTALYLPFRRKKRPAP